MKIGAVVFFLILVEACSPKIESISPPIEEPESFTETNGQEMIGNWWESFEDEQLNILMDSAFAYNMDLAFLWSRLEEAQAIRKSQFTRLLPDINSEAQTAISRPEPDFAGGENTQIGASASYEVDLWGRIRAGVQAEDFRIQATYYDYKAAAVTLSANVTRLWFQLLTAREQVKMINKQIKTNEQVINLIRTRFDAGQVKGVDVLRQEQLLEQTKSLKIEYEANLNLIENQLAVLLGKPPQNFEIEGSESLPELPPQPTTGLPLDLIRRRPDVQRDYNFLMAADRDMAVAVRNKFPRLSLSLSSQARSNTYSELFNDWAYTLGANLFAPLLYWGRLRAEVDRAEAVKNQQLYQYGQSVLNAFREVENAVINENRQNQQVEILRKRLSMAQKTNRQLRIEFINGFSQYLDVLLAQEQEQQLQRNMLEAIQNLYEIRISLYRSLAGDFNMNPEEEADLNETETPN